MRCTILHSPVFNVLLFSVFWALQIFVGKLAFSEGADPVCFTIQSGVVAFFVLTVYVLPRKIQEIKSTPKGIIGRLMLANAVHFGLGIFFCNAGTALTTAINVGFLVKFGVVTTTFLAWIFIKEKITLPKITSVLTMLLGGFLISTKGELIIPHLGDILIILACLCWSTANVMVRKILRDSTVSDEIVSFLRPVAGVPLLVCFVFLSPLYPEPIRKVFEDNIFEIISPFFVAVNGLFLALMFLYLNKTLKVASASYMAMMSMATPVIVSILAMVFLRESIQFVQLVGAFLIISSGAVTHYLQIEKQ